MNYKEFAQTANELLGEHGTKCILRNPSNTPPVYNPETNDYDKQEEKFNGFCIVSSFDNDAVDGTIILASDSKIIAVLSGKPVPKLSILDVYNKDTGKLEDSYHVENSTPVRPDATTTIVYQLQCRM